MDYEPAHGGERRSFLRFLILLCSGVIALISSVPVVGYLLAPVLNAGQRRRRKVLMNLPSDGNTAGFIPARYEGQEEAAPGLYVKMEQGKPTVLYAKCTHAACSVHWDSSAGQFLCPCHGGRFKPDGSVAAGPPPKPLEKLTANVVDGALYVEEPEA